MINIKSIFRLFLRLLGLGIVFILFALWYDALSSQDIGIYLFNTSFLFFGILFFSTLTVIAIRLIKKFLNPRLG